MPHAHTTRGGQLRPLKERMSQKNLLRRAAKVEMRKKLGIEYAMLLGRYRVAQSILLRGFWGRLKFALFKQ